MRSPWGVAVSMIAIGVLARVLPHPPNFSPIASLALFGGVYFASKRLAVLVTLAAMLITDGLIGWHGSMWATYSAFLFSVLLGRWVRRSPDVTRIAVGTLTGSVVFFLVTNFAHWLRFYGGDPSTLGACYTLAIPFFQNTLLGDCFFSSVLFGTSALCGMPTVNRPALVRRTV